MKIAISNLAWKKSMDEKVFRLMHDLGISCIEISPFRDYCDVSEAQKQFSESILNVLSCYGIRIIAFQSLMFRYSEEVASKLVNGPLMIKMETLLRLQKLNKF